MAEVLEEAVQNQWNPSDTKTLTLPATPPSGRTLVCRFASDTIPSTPTGWTRVDAYPGGQADVGIFLRISDGSVNSITLTANGDTSARLEHWSGLDTTSIAALIDSSNTNNGSPATGSVVTTAAACLLLAAIAMGSPDGSGVTWSAWTNSFTEDSDQPSPGGEGNEISLGTAHRVVSSTGTYSTAATQSSGSNANASGAIVALVIASSGDQELNVPHFANVNQIFAPTIQNQSPQELDVPHLASGAQLFVPTPENQSAQELNVPHLASSAQVFQATVTGGDQNLDVPHLASAAQIFAPTVENQTAQELAIPHLASTAQLFALTVENQAAQELAVPFFQNMAVIYQPTIFNEGEELFEPILAGNGSLADRIFNGLISQGFLTGTIVDREYARLLNKLSLTAPQAYSLEDLYSLANEDNRIEGIGIDQLTPA